MNTTTRSADLINHYTTAADRAAHEAMAQAVQRAFDFAKELERELARLERAKSMDDKQQALSNAINHCASNLLGNLRLDMMAKAQAQIAAAAEMRRAAGLDNDDTQMIVILTARKEG